MTSDGPAQGSSLRPGGWEVGIALLVVILAVQVLAAAGGGEGFHPADPLGYLLTGLAAATVALSRRQPLLALVVASSLTTALAWLDYHVDVLQFVVTGLLFMVASYSTRRTAVIGLAVATALLYVSAASGPEDLGPQIVLQSMGIFTAAWALGRLTRSRRTALLAQVSLAEHRAAAEKELAAAERDRITLTQVEERLRIARDVHDVLAHSISVVSVQATVGAHLATNDPDAARQALLTISDVSRTSMGELRQMLALLRDDTAADPADGPPYEPARGLKDVEQLVETYRAAGLPVRISTDGTPRRLSASADLCAYRIIQEALTNTLKHAGPSTASVGITYDVEALVVEVSDDGRGAGATIGGHGLVGMRERTSLLGGRLAIGPTGTSGFSVTATIPYEAPDPVSL